AKVTRHFEFNRDDGMWAINGQFFDETLRRVDANPRSGNVEIWHLVNKGGGWSHPIHLHLTNFQILDPDGGKSPAVEQGWQEPSLLGENESAHIIMRWPDVPNGPPPSPPGGAISRTNLCSTATTWSTRTMP